MSKFDALRHLWGKVPWLQHDQVEPGMEFPDPPSRVEEMRHLVLQAGSRGRVDPHSATWGAVCGWAANELLETLYQAEVRDVAIIPALQARIKVLREVLALEHGPAPEVKFDDESRHIP